MRHAFARLYDQRSCCIRYIHTPARECDTAAINIKGRNGTNYRSLLTRHADSCLNAMGVPRGIAVAYVRPPSSDVLRTDMASVRRNCTDATQQQH